MLKSSNNIFFQFDVAFITTIKNKDLSTNMLIRIKQSEERKDKNNKKF